MLAATLLMHSCLRGAGRVRHIRLAAAAPTDSSSYHVPVLCAEAVEWLRRSGVIGNRDSEPAGTETSFIHSFAQKNFHFVH